MANQTHYNGISRKYSLYIIIQKVQKFDLFKASWESIIKELLDLQDTEKEIEEMLKMQNQDIGGKVSIQQAFL